jgi:hypothetical protein
VTAIRLRLLKIGAVITRNTRRIRLWLSSSFPLQELPCSCLVRFSGWALRGADPGTRKTMAAYPRCPVMPLLRHHLARFSAKNFTIDSNHVSPLREPSHGAKSGLSGSQL